MVKKQLLACLFAALSCFLCNSIFAQDSINVSSSNKETSKHLEFKGIPIDGTVNEFVAKLEKLGYILTEKEKDGAFLSGQFTGKEATIVVMGTMKSSTVSMVCVQLPKNNTWFGAKSEYMYYKELFTQKYGEPSRHREGFDRPYYEGDGYELSALSRGKCHYTSLFVVENGTIMISLGNGGRLSIFYEDTINSKIDEAEKASSIINDI